MEMEVERKCRRCHATKPLTEFALSKTSRGGRRWQCNDCRRNGQAKCQQRYRAKNRNSENMKNAVRHQQIKDYAFAAYGGYCCVWCGCTEKENLQIDHLNNDGKAHRKSLSDTDRKLFFRYLKKAGYPSGYQVLCRQCNVYKYLLFKSGASTTECPKTKVGTPAWCQRVEQFARQMGGIEALKQYLSNK